ncbi:MAG: hypothetical protein ACE5GW_07320, partial [Planctomycetota bacterium]
PSELVGFDEIEEVRRLERLRLGARNILLTRTSPHRPTGDDGEAPAPRGASRRKLLESRLEIDYFPRPKRDHDGDVWSLLDGEMLLYPRSGLALFVDGELDTARQGRIEQLNSGISVGVADGSSLSLSRRFSRRLHHSLGAALHWIPSRRYEFAAFHEYDIRGGEPLNQHYSVVRNFHRWLVMFSLEIDEGERNNTTFKVWIGPRQVWGGIRGALRRG